MYVKQARLMLVFIVMAVLVLASCAPAATPTPPPPPAAEPTPVPPADQLTPTPDDQLTPTPDEPGLTPTPDGDVTPTPPPDDAQFEGETVSVLAVWGGDELESFLAMVAPWEERTGATIDYEGTRDLNAVLTTRVQGGNPPDIAGLPGPGQLQEYARDGELVDLSTFMDMNALRDAYDESWVELATYNGGVYGIFTKAAVKSMIWYSPSAFEEAGYEVPETWNEMIALSDQMVEDGVTPWCLCLESGAASGWPGTDWIEDIMLRTAGPDLYDQWWRHEIPWTHDAVRNAWEIFGIIVTNEDYVYDGTTGVLATNFGECPYPMFEEPIGCYMHRQASFIQSFIEEQFPDLEAEEDFTFFPFPEIDPNYGVPSLSAGDLFGMFNDRPVVRSLMEWLASAEAQEIWVRRGGFIAPNRDVPLDAYPDDLTRQAAEILVTAEVVRFDASDMMPAAVNDAFWAGVLEFVQNPGNLDAILQRIEEVAQESYPETYP
jgi:alpha-glucoside transport system substrate-binding protein